MHEREKELTFEFDFDDRSFRQAKLAVIGVGGGGGNAVRTMFNTEVEQVTYLVANTDLQALDHSCVTSKVQLGPTVTKGLGAGADPNRGREAALESKDTLVNVLKETDMLFITAGMGGGTGTGAAPVIAQVARDMGILTVAVVTKPFLFEGRHRMAMAEKGIAQLQEVANTLIVIPNEKLLSIAGNLSFKESFKRADDVLVNAVRGISDLITNAGYINVDFADVKAVMSNSGYALMGTGIASGENRAIEATQSAIESPLLDDISIQGAKGILVNVTGSSDVSLNEVSAAANYIYEAAGGEAQVIFGLVEDESMGDHLKVTVIATGFDTPAVAAKEENPRTRAWTHIPEPQVQQRPTTTVDISNMEIPTTVRKKQVEMASVMDASRAMAPVMATRRVPEIKTAFSVTPPPLTNLPSASIVPPLGAPAVARSIVSDAGRPAPRIGNDVVIPSFRRKLKDL